MTTDRRQFLQTMLAAVTLPVKHVRGLLNRATATRLPRPTKAQLAWQRDELAMFLHFGVNWRAAPPSDIAGLSACRTARIADCASLSTTQLHRRRSRSARLVRDLGSADRF